MILIVRILLDPYPVNNPKMHSYSLNEQYPDSV